MFSRWHQGVFMSVRCNYIGRTGTARHMCVMPHLSTCCVLQTCVESITDP